MRSIEKHGRVDDQGPKILDRKYRPPSDLWSDVLHVDDALVTHPRAGDGRVPGVGDQTAVAAFTDSETVDGQTGLG